MGKERLAEPEKYIEPYKDLIRFLVSDLKLGTEEEVIKIIGYFDVNSLAVRGDCGEYKGRGIYPLAALMNHSCICNTRNLMTGRGLECRATIPVSGKLSKHTIKTRPCFYFIIIFKRFSMKYFKIF